MSRQQLNILIDYTILPKISTYRKEFVIFFESKYYVQSELTDLCTSREKGKYKVSYAKCNPNSEIPGILKSLKYIIGFENKKIVCMKRVDDYSKLTFNVLLKDEEKEVLMLENQKSLQHSYSLNKDGSDSGAIQSCLSTADNRIISISKTLLQVQNYVQSFYNYLEKNPPFTLSCIRLKSGYFSWKPYLYINPAGIINKMNKEKDNEKKENKEKENEEKKENPFEYFRNNHIPFLYISPLKILERKKKMEELQKQSKEEKKDEK